MKKNLVLEKHKYLAIATVVVFVTIPSSVFAISIGYLTNDRGLSTGMAVKLSDESTEGRPLAERADEVGADKFVGISTNIEDSSVTIASSEQSVYVENEGEVEAYVSDINGEVKNGDQLTVSSLKGILAKASDDSQIIVGTALADFSINGAESHEVKTPTGLKQANINLIRFNLDAKNVVGLDKVDSSLERLGRSIVGKDVSEIRVIAALAIFIVVLAICGAVMYGAVSSAIKSFGRNPLAKKQIQKELFVVVSAAIGMLFAGIIAVYLVLWL